MEIQKIIELTHSAILWLLRFLVSVLVIAMSLLILYAVLLPSLLGDLDFNRFLTYNGYFSTWSPFEQPPSAIEKIIRVDGNKVVWIKTKAGDIYSKSFHRFGSEKYLPWKRQKEANFSNTHLYSEQFGSCEVEYAHSYEKTFGKPPEKVFQCTRLEEANGNSTFIWYFALSENGKLWMYHYWQDDTYILFIFCFQTTGIGILLFAILRFVLGKLKLRLESAAQNG